MTNIADLDAEIVRAADIVERCLRGTDLARDVRISGLIAAVNSKRAASRPQPLTAKEACALVSWADLPVTLQNVQAVIDACRERDLKVIEALPKWGYDHAAKSLAVVNLGELVSVRDIRSALTSGGQ